MFKTLKATLAAALVTLGVIASQAQTANAFTAPAPDAITTAGSLATNVSCGGVDCDHSSQRGYTYYGRYKSERHCRVGGGAPAGLTSVRRSNRTCSFPASGFHKGALPR